MKLFQKESLLQKHILVYLVFLLERSYFFRKRRSCSTKNKIERLVFESLPALASLLLSIVIYKLTRQPTIALYAFPRPFNEEILHFVLNDGDLSQKPTSCSKTYVMSNAVRHLRALYPCAYLHIHPTTHHSAIRRPTSIQISFTQQCSIQRKVIIKLQRRA